MRGFIPGYSEPWWASEPPCPCEDGQPCTRHGQYLDTEQAPEPPAVPNPTEEWEVAS